MFTQPALWNRFVAALLVLAVVSCGAAAQNASRDKLRQAVPLPHMEGGFHFDFGARPSAPPDEAGARAQIAALEAAPAPVTGEGLLRLGQLYTQVKDYARAKATYERAVPLWRQASAAHPDDAALLVPLGKALQGAVRLDEAEAALRRAVQVAPQNASAWATLGEVLLLKATGVLLPVEKGFQFNFGATPSFEGLNATLLDSRPAPEAIARSQAIFDEAGASYERAVQVAPSDPDVYRERIGFRASGAFLGGLLQSLRAEETATLKVAMGNAAQGMMATMFSPEIAADLQTIARLKPSDASTNGAAALSTLVAYSMRNRRDFPLKGGLESLPAPVAAAVREVMERLETLAKAGGKDESAALSALGVVRFVLADPLALDALRRAVALDPSQVQAHELLATLLILDNRFDELATLMETRLQREDTARNHLILAKAYDKLNRPQNVGEQVSAALEREPGDLTANLARAALLLRAGDVAQADQQLTRTAKLLAPEAKPSRQQTLDYGLLRGVFLALSGQTEAARQQLQSVLAAEPKNEAASQALAALNP